MYASRPISVHFVDNKTPPEQKWLLNIEAGSKVIEVKGCLRVSLDLVYSATPNAF